MNIKVVASKVIEKSHNIMFYSNLIISEQVIGEDLFFCLVFNENNNIKGEK